jgi:hypothetical protein
MNTTTTTTTTTTTVIRIEKQNPNERQDLKKAPFHNVEERRYNDLGHCIEVDDIDWLKFNNESREREQRITTIMEYDVWGQIRRVTKRSSGETLPATWSISDPKTLTHMEGIEREEETKSSFNLFGSPIRKEI